MPPKDAYHMIDKLHAARETTLVRTIYDEWASSYDQDLETLGYHGPAIGARLLSEYLPDRRALILDAGCGTGLVGEWLYKQGYQHLHGTDYSQEMLATAAEKNVYQTLFPADFQQALAIETDVYDALICIGVTGPRFRASVLNDFARIVKPNGILCISFRVAWYGKYGIKEHIEKMVADQIIKQVAEVQQRYMDGQDADALYGIFQVVMA